MEEFIADLSGDDETDRIYAAQDLGETGDPAAAAPLVSRLPDESSQAVRDAIVFALKGLPCQEIYADLLRLFHSPDPYLRNSAIDIFGSDGSDAVPFLVSKTDIEDGEVRKLILDALYVTTAPEALAPIRARLEDPAVNVRITAVEYLGRLEDRESLDILLDMLRREEEPMFRIAVLDTVLKTAVRQQDIRSALYTLAPDGDFKSVDSFFLPQVIRLAALTGDADMIASVASDMPDGRMASVYGEDTVHALEQASLRHPDLLAEPPVRDILVRIMAENSDSAVQELCSALLREPEEDRNA